jgi:hypothetical protein
VWYYPVYRFDDCAIFAAITVNGSVDADLAAVHPGMAMSTQFTAMNTITLADLTDENASSGNSVLAVTQQLSISLGVAVSAAVLRFYEGFDSANTVEQFHYTFMTMGAITLVSALTFMLLKPKDGRNLIKEKH